MHTSPSMQFVLMRAEAEVKAAHLGALCVECIFLGILKLAEVKASQIMEAPSAVLQAVDRDIAAVAKALKDAGISSSRTRGLLRSVIARNPSRNQKQVSLYFDRANAYASERGEGTYWAQDLLKAILRDPTDAILQVCPIRKEKAAERVSSEKKDAETREEMGRSFLPQLTSRIRTMRAKLLSNVYGQDHVVHAFAEGIFAAEVLAASDEKRKRPRAIFVFAGPPGVGKTFLAEQAAEALEIPFKRFDMSSYSDHQAYMGLVGFEKSYQAAKTGTLTGFVKEHPHAILLFDEIEKAHLNTIQLFLQILDAGRLHDRFEDEQISFKDTIIIFTTNAGRSLYEGDARENCAGIPRKNILNALETEKNPQNGQPFFPAAITSRMATGWPMLFNHLQPHHLEKISGGELDKCCGLFEKQYGIQAAVDKFVPAALLFQEGGAVDARVLRAQTELFFKNEIFKVCRLWEEAHFSQALDALKNIRFTVETENLPADVRPLFHSAEKPEILLYGSPLFADRFRKELPGYTLYDTLDPDEAMKIAGEKDIRLALIDIAGQKASQFYQNIMETIYGNRSDTIAAFDFAPMAAGALHEGSKLFRALHERLPELPVYLLETDAFRIDGELEMSFVRSGARGKLAAPRESFAVFEDVLSGICRELYMQSVASKLAGERKVLYFETAPKLSRDRGSVTIRLRDFSLKRAVAAEDADSVLDDLEKPDVRFSDVIGAADAKDELKFFIDFLKNPRKYAAQGLKPPKGVLLYGPPGTGKTMLAKAMAGESDVAFLPAVASSFVTKYQGSGPEAVRALFRKARRYAPSILFIDEIDAIGRKRGGSNSAHGEEMALNALLAEMDGFSVDPKRPVFVLAATNFDVEEGQGGIGVIDPALTRRFDRRILVDLPNEGEREQFIRMQLKKNSGHIVTEEMIRRLASRAIGMSPANLAAVFALADRMARKAGTPLDDAILDEAYELTRHGAKKDWGRAYLERVARHESGHALLHCLGGNTPSYLTIVARGSHGGYMEHSAADVSPLATKEELLNRIRTSLAGRAAEIVYYGDCAGISTGISGDLEQATRTAAAMICTYGMYEDFGLAAMDLHQAASDPAVRQQINRILAQEMRNTMEIIQKNRIHIDRLVDALIRKNKLSGQQIREMLKAAEA